MADLTRRRLDLAGTRGFAAEGAGQARRATLAAFGRQWLTDQWATATDGTALPGVALAAVGSLARGDGGPLSDYDLVLLHSGRAMSPRDLERLADRLWYPMWDAGVSIDHSVRTVAQCRQVAGADLTAAVGLLDLTLVVGDDQLVEAARSTLARDWRANARTRLPELTEAVAARHARMGEAAHLLEPDLKEARGGLRDMTVLRAIAAAWLADRPHGPVDAAYQRLLDVRDAIHVVTGRGRDRLGHEERDAVAALLGYDDPDLLLTDVSGAARELAYALDGTLRRAGQSRKARLLRVGPRRPAMQALGFGLFRHEGEVVLGPGVDPATDPTLALRAAVLAARHGLTVAPTTLTNLKTKCPPLADPWPAEALALFGDLLATGAGLIPVWEGLDLAGIITEWLPEWSPIRSRPQHNPVHRHTVDRHSVETVVTASELVRDVHRADLLTLAALFHDIGKASAGLDHAEVGAMVAQRLLTRLGLPEPDRTVVVTLIREHLTLVDLATRRDPTDPVTVDTLVAAVGGSAPTLHLLRALTEADARAAGPAAWSQWRATLVDRLVSAGLRRLGGGSPVAPDECEDDLQLPMALTAEVVAQVRSGQPVVTAQGAGAAYRLSVVDRDRIGLFADVAGLFAAEGLVVRSAILRTLDGIAVDEWQVEIPRGLPPDPAALARGLSRLTAGDRAPLAPLQRRDRSAARSRRAGPAQGLTRALIVPGASSTATVIEVRASDRPGLLHRLAGSVAQAGLSVRSAHIATYAGQAVDTFYLTRADGSPLPPAAVATTIATLIEAADGPADSAGQSAQASGSADR